MGFVKKKWLKSNSEQRALDFDCGGGIGFCRVWQFETEKKTKIIKIVFFMKNSGRG